jgi:hypothetical protein
MMSVDKHIHRLVELQESRTGKPNNRHELRFLLQWIHEECKLRWPNVSKREVWGIVRKIDGYDFERQEDGNSEKKRSMG